MYSTTGWLKKYLAKRNQYISETSDNKQIMPNSIDIDEHLFYEVVQPTGLIYGCPVSLPDIESEKLENLNSAQIVKLALSESLFLSSQIFDNNEDINEQTLSDIVRFYDYLFPELGSGFFRKLFGSKKAIAKAEDLIEKQIKLRTGFDNFWAGFFLNSLLFLDVIYFSVWLKSKNTKPSSFLKKEREEIFMLLLQIISIAIHADNKIDDNEIHFYNLFLKSSKLSKANRKKAKEFLHYPPNLSHINLKHISSWLLKKYILEIAILAIWTDKEVDNLELKFLRELTQKLKLNQEELETGMMAVEIFVLNNWDSLPYFKGKKSYEIVSANFIKSFKRAVNSNKRKIAKEISESKELMALLKKSRKEELNNEEKEQVKGQIFDILKTIPMFVIFLLPGSFITLPILFKIIPKNILFPSSFLDDEHK